MMRIIWSQNTKHLGRFEKIPLSITEDSLKVLYANSITLTPGTFTINIEEDFLLIHAINKNTSEDLLEGTMERRILELEQANAIHELG